MANKTFTRKYSVSVDSDMTGQNEGDRVYRATQPSDAAMMAALDYVNDAIQNGMDSPKYIEFERINELQILIVIDADDDYDPENIALTVRETD